MIQDKVLVHDELCERKLLGSVLLWKGAYFEVAEFLTDDCFYSAKNRKIWQAIQAVTVKGNVPDVITVSAELSGTEVSQFDVVSVTEAGGDLNYVTYAIRLKTLCIRRQLWLVGQKLVSAGENESEDIDEVRQKATDGINGLFEKIEGVFTLSDAISSLFDIIQKNYSKGTSLTGTPTGFTKLDEKGGLQNSDLIVIGGETSQGKTSLLTTITRNAIERGAKIAFYSMEMTKEQIAARLMAMSTGIMANRIMYSGELSDQEIIQLENAKRGFSEYGLFFDDSSTSNIDSILLSIRNMKMKYDINGAVIDYLQILNVNQRGSGYSREQAMGDASRRLKNLAKELGIWIIALSQLSRNAQDPEPNLNRLRDSGQIAEAADVVMFIYRPEYYNKKFPYPFEDVDDVKGKAMIDVAKGRNIGVFKFLVRFDPNTTCFSDITDTYANDIARYANNIQGREDDAPF